MSEPSVSDLRLFAAISRLASFRAAALEADLAPSSVSHRIRILEERLGTRLFNRTTRSVRLTEAGERFLARVLPILDDFDAIWTETRAEQGDIAGLLRINAPSSAVRQLLQTVVPVFLDRYPGVTLDLRTEDRLVDIVAEGSDAGIRLGEAVPPDMIAVPFGGPARFVVVAAPDYLAGRSVPRVPEDLRDHACIQIRLPSGRLYRWELERQGQTVVVDVPGTLILDRADLTAAAAEQGLGVAFVLERHVTTALAEGRLMPLLEDWCPEEPGLTLYYPGRRRVPPALRAFINTLRDIDRTHVRETARS